MLPNGGLRLSVAERGAHFGELTFSLMQLACQLLEEEAMERSGLVDYVHGGKYETLDQSRQAIGNLTELLSTPSRLVTVHLQCSD
jgi:hypothetical protein